MKELCDKFAAYLFHTETHTLEDSTEVVSSSTPDTRFTGVLSYLNQSKTNKGQPTSSKVRNLKSKSVMKINKYLGEPMQADPIKFWLNYGDNDLKNFALKYTGICGTSVASEQVFSGAKYTFGERSTRLTTKHVKEVIFLQKNLQM